MPTGITITRGRNVWSKLEDEIKKTLLIEFEYLYLRLPRTNVRVHLERVASAQKMEFGELLSVWTVYRQHKGGKHGTPELGSAIAKASKVGKEISVVVVTVNKFCLLFALHLSFFLCRRKKNQLSRGIASPLHRLFLIFPI